MSLFIASLNSGSSGNCYYVGNEQEAILVDAGISCREIEKRMSNLHLEMEKVKAVFISHEHTDHIKGVDKLARKHNLPVYITTATRNNTRLGLKKVLLETFNADEPV
ncbi:MAG: MBL fold metallo-hydrolase, partial [Bacteroidota bacterium]